MNPSVKLLAVAILLLSTILNATPAVCIDGQLDYVEISYYYLGEWNEDHRVIEGETITVDKESWVDVKICRTDAGSADWKFGLWVDWIWSSAKWSAAQCVTITPQLIEPVTYHANIDDGGYHRTWRIDTICATSYYRDSDSDGYGDPGDTLTGCGPPPGGYVLNDEDCDDNDPDEHPDQTWYKDSDGDGYSDGQNTSSCPRPAGYKIAAELIQTTGDCNDNNAGINPGASEVCNTIDDDCNGVIDDGVGTTYYRDADGDGYGNPAISETACDPPSGYVLNNTDCNDDDPNEHPIQTWYKDADDDGYSDGQNTSSCPRPAGYKIAAELIQTTGDCNDNNAGINPGASEVCNTIDDDCNGVIDDGVRTTWYRDADGDGYGNPAISVTACDPPSGYVLNNTDCNDDDPNEHPIQTWYKDADDDGYSDGRTNTVLCTRPAGYKIAAELIRKTGDCRDDEATINPGAAEVCNAIDDNCDDVIDDDSAVTYYRDSDGDGYGNPHVSATAMGCAPLSGYVANNTDCDDGDPNEHPGQIWYKDEDHDGCSNGDMNTESCIRPVGFKTASELNQTSGDCRDDAATIHPDAAEVCNGIDDNCSGEIDEGVLITWRRDADGDGYGNPDISETACAAPPGYVLNDTDCNDDDPNEHPIQTWYKDADDDGCSDGRTNTSSCTRPAGYKPAAELIRTAGDCRDDEATINPGATEVCNGFDDDCNDVIDDDSVVTYFRDSDGDGYGDPQSSSTSIGCAPPQGYVSNNMDCDDGDPNEHPGQTWHRDADGDGHGDPENSVTACNQPSGYVSTNTDCDDNDAAELPGQTWYRDADNDGHGDPANPVTACNPPSGYVLNDTDCDDADPDEHPAQTWCRDADNDGYSDGHTNTASCTRPAGFKIAAELIRTTGDCRDDEATVYPGAVEICNGLDDDCDGDIDEGPVIPYYLDGDNDGFGNPDISVTGHCAPAGYVDNDADCDDGDRNEHPGQVWYKDADNDGYSDATRNTTACTRPQDYKTDIELTRSSGDCDDHNAEVHPGAAEICNNLDDNCNENVDEGLVVTWYRDADEDGYGDPGRSTRSCSPVLGYVLNNTDCDDDDPEEHPGQTWYRDADADGYSDGAANTSACSRPVGYAPATELIMTSGDCNDSDGGIHPGAAELCNGVDDDCDGSVEEGHGRIWHLDEDRDGYGVTNVWVVACVAPDGYVSKKDDCDDDDPTLNPGAAEMCNNRDDNCNTRVDENAGERYFRDKDGDGFGDPADSLYTCEAPMGYVTDGTDCNDDDPDEFPGQVWYKDMDDDYYSDGVKDTESCSRPVGYKTESELLAIDNDGDDADPAVIGDSGKIHKAIIVAGGGPYAGDNLWQATLLCANFAYKTLITQGYEKENIRYLSDESTDADANGKFDDVSAPAANAELEQAILAWAGDADTLFLYMVDHGGEGSFRMRAEELLYAEALDSWLDERQKDMPGALVMLYDACQSGSFLPKLIPPDGKERILAASTIPGQEAIFIAGGAVSFSYMFWGRMMNGDSFYDAYVYAANGVGATYNQTPVLDANGNGIENEKEDKDLAVKVRLGREIRSAADIPCIGRVSPAATLIDADTAVIYAEEVIDVDGIAHVGAVIIPPDFVNPSVDTPVTDVPVVELFPAGGNRFETEVKNLSTVGRYRVSIYAQDAKGEISPPRTTSITVSDNSEPLCYRLYFPHVITADDWETEVGVVNADSARILIGNVSAFDRNGDKISNEIIVALPPMGRRWIDVESEFDQPDRIEYLVFEGDGEAVRGYSRYAAPGRYGMVVPAAARPGQENAVVSHIASDPVWQTDIGLINTAAVSKHITIEFDSGDDVAMDLGPGEHRAFSIRDIFGGTPRPDIGSAVITNSADLVGVELFRNESKKILSGVLISDEKATRMVYPHIVTNAGWGTDVVAYNPSPLDCPIRIVPYTDAGDALNPVTHIIPGREKYIGVVSELGLPARTQWLAIEADHPVTGFELFTGPNLMGSYTGVNITRRKGIFPRLEMDGATGIAFVNIGDRTAAITLTAYDDWGRNISTVRIMIEAYVKRVDLAANLFPEDITTATYVAYESTQDVVGFELNMTADGMVLEGLPGL